MIAIALITLLTALPTILRSAPEPDKGGFTKNLGQWNSRAHFHARFDGLDVWITDNEILFEQFGPELQSHVMAMEFVDGMASQIEGVGRMSASTAFIIGNNEGTWVPAAPSFRGVLLRSVYDGVDVAVRIDNGRPRYDFVVHPGASPSDIRLRFRGASGLSIDGRGNLVLDTDVGPITHAGLKAFQEINGRRVEVASAFELTDGLLGFVIGDYDATLSLVIDPLVTSTYLGGSGEDVALGTFAVDDGTFWVTGRTASTDFPGTSLGQRGAFDVFATQYSSAGKQLRSVILGGSGSEVGYGVFANAEGKVLLSGWTDSEDFPIANAHQSFFGGDRGDVFVTKLDPGDGMIYSTYLGGSGDDRAVELNVTPDGSAYVAGWSWSQDFPTSDAYQDFNGGERDAIIAAFTAEGVLIYSTYVGGDGEDFIWGLDVDDAGNAWVTGQTNSAAFPLPGNGIRNSRDAFAVGFDSRVQLIGQFVFGGSRDDGGQGISLGGDNTILITGEAESADFKVTDGSSLKGVRDAFVMRVDRDSGELLYSTLIGGSSLDAGFAIEAGPNDEAVITGWTGSSDYPTTADALDRTLNGSRDAVITVLDRNGILQHSTFFGGGDWEIGRDLDVDSNGNIVIVGDTRSFDLPLKSPADGDFNGGRDDAFFTVYDAGIEVVVEDFEWLSTNFITDAVPLDLAASPVGPVYELVYRTNSDQVEVYKSSDSGQTWSKIADDKTLSALAVSDGGVLYVGASDGVMFRSRNAGDSFERPASGVASTRPIATMVA
ncbi:MAG: hypothetical protein ACC655_06090, partial [Rhodothermia bacterium]